MWGSWLTILSGGVLALLLIVAIAFGTSALLFPVLIAIAIFIVLAVSFMLRRGAAETKGGGAAATPGGPPRGSGHRPSGAPVSGEGGAPRPTESPHG